MGDIDLDPASFDLAQEQVVKAKKYYTKENDGLLHHWSGRVWMNPPFSDGLISFFVDKLIEETCDAYVSEYVVLTDNKTDTGWFDRLWHRSDCMCLTTGRIRFMRPQVRKNVILMSEEVVLDYKSTAANGHAIFYYGPHVKAFIEEFDTVGNIMARPTF
jgi:phage N-6-adenine-methyltransferase